MVPCTVPHAASVRCRAQPWKLEPMNWHVTRKRCMAHSDRLSESEMSGLRVLLVDAFSTSRQGRRQFRRFKANVRQALQHVPLPKEATIIVRRPE